MPTTFTLTTLAVFAVGYVTGHADQLTGRWLIARARRKQQAAA